MKKVAKVGIKKEAGCLYMVDDQGDVSVIKTVLSMKNAPVKE